jgi:hypothetical protein
MRILGIPIPRRFVPVGRTIEQGTEDGWEVAVRIAIPVLGELMRYEGRLRWLETTEIASS